MEARNSKRLAVTAIYIMTFYHFIHFSNCSRYATLNLNEWLTEFDNCNVKISNIDPNIWDVGKFEYPVILSKSNASERSPPNCQYLSPEISNETKRNCFEQNYPVFSKRIFCTANAVVIPQIVRTNYRSGPAAVKMFQPVSEMTPEPDCSKSVYPSNDDSPPTQYKWTECILILVVKWDREMGGKVLSEINQIFAFSSLIENRHAFELFVFSYLSPNVTTSTDLTISVLDYACRLCINTNPPKSGSESRTHL